MFSMGEVKEILHQVLEAQKNQDPRNLPIVFLQAWTENVVFKAFNQVKDEYDKATERFMAEATKAVEEFEKEVNSVLK